MPIAEILTEAKDSRIVEALARINDIASKGFLRSAMEEAFMLVSIAPTYLPLHIQMAEFMLKMGNQEAAMQKFIVVSEAYGTRGEHQPSHKPAQQGGGTLSDGLQSPPLSDPASGGDRGC